MEQLIRTALATYSADRIAKFDYSLENSGGVVVSSSDTYPPALETYSLMGVPLWTVPSSPKAIIQVHCTPTYNHVFIINPRCPCAARVTVVVVCVCLSVHYSTSHFNCSTNNTTYSASGIGRKICRVFSETAAFGSYGMKHERKSQYA